MKKYYLICLIMLLTTWSAYAQTRTFTFTNDAEEGMSVVQNTKAGLQMRHALKQVSLVTITDNGYTGEIVEGGKGITLPANAGEPNLPSFSRFVAVPNGATAHVEMDYRSMTTLRNVDLLPAAPIKFDTDDSPNTYEKKQSIYSRDAFYPESPVTVSEPFSLRGVEAVAVTVVPYQYNPVTKELRVYDDLQFSVGFDGGNGEFGDTRLRSPYWDPILMQNLVNYNQLPVIDYEARMQEWVSARPDGCEYLIVIPNNEDFRPYANQLKEYRTQQGIITEVKSLAEMECTTTAQMKTYFHNAYNTWTIPPVAVLLLGDHNTNMAAGIPAETTYHSSSYGNCITDNGYADVTGDNLPEMAFSRLVAANATEAQMMVSKQLEYEFTNPNMDASTYEHPITALGWQTERWFQICSEAVGGYWRNHGKNPVRINAVYQGSPGSTWSSNANTYMVVNYFGPNGTGYIPATPSELGGWTGGTGSQVVTAVNSGCMMLQHRDHGYYQGWGEPSFSISYVNQMTNVGKLTFVNTINCQTGTFDYGQGCLIEAFMRRTYNNENAGAVGCIGPTQTSYSFVNDTYVWGLYDQYDPDFLPDYGPYANYEGNWRPAFGNVAGKYFLQQSSWPTNPNSKEITHKMFTAHCDAFLTLYTEVPTAMEVSHPSQITSTTTSVSVTAPAGAVVALTCNDAILAVATATGTAQSINFAAQPSGSDITIVATKQDRLRYVGSIPVISEPSLVVNEVSVLDVNGNGYLEYGEQASFNITIVNNGDLASTEASLTLEAESDEYITISQNTASMPALEPQQSTTLEGVFEVTVADNVPDGTPLVFLLTIADNGHSWTREFSFDAHAPNVVIDKNVNIADNGNGRLDPGEETQIEFLLTNDGRMTANGVVATLTTSNLDHITIVDPTIEVGDVNVGDELLLTFDISISALMPRGDSAVFVLTTTHENYLKETVFCQRVGLECANFENGMDDFEWENDAEHPWVLVDDEVYSGQYSLRSGSVGPGETSSLSITYNVENDNDEIRFFRKTLTQVMVTYLDFAIDGEVIDHSTWPQDWNEMAVPVTQGEHVFTWSYLKSDNGTQGDDKALIDEILFPVKHLDLICNAGLDQQLCKGEVQLEAFASGYMTLLWSSDGDGTFSSPDIVNPVYTPGEQDRENGSVTLTMTVTGDNGDVMSDDMLVDFFDDAVIEMAEDTTICEGESCLLTPVIIASDSVLWETNGDGVFDDVNSAEAQYEPGPQDVDNGVVVLTLTATSVYGCADATHTFTINIVKNPLLEDIEGEVEIDVYDTPTTTYSVQANIESLTYTWSVTPAEAAEIEYESGNATLQWSEDFKGEAVIGVIADNDCGEAEKTLTVNVKNSTDVNEYGVHAKVYPNPSSGVVAVEAADMRRIVVCNVLGQTLADIETSGDVARINLASYGHGTYLLKIITGGGTAVKRVNVIH